MRILLAIDGSSFSDEAVKGVATRPWPAGSEVRIISVVEHPLLPMVESWVPPDDYLEALDKAGEDQARSIVGKAANRIQEEQRDKLRVATEIVKGHPRHAILSAAETWEADLIVVGSHGYRGLTKLWLGSVSQAVASHAKCSVEIVRKREA
ncbi:MAG TPA: universal stress protein [Blastocatellia bacterium]|jgi:nucleotide-binding universal stress UspA family protein|nr:universal stress protein [Blastocatellia bacterium]